MLAVMIFVNQIMSIGASAFFALSGQAHSVKHFVLYQIIGGLFGLGINRLHPRGFHRMAVARRLSRPCWDPAHSIRWS
jgi:hypothetical protein